MEQHRNTQPYIVAYGSSKDNITHYSISVDNDLIKVNVAFFNLGNNLFHKYFTLLQIPDNFSFMETLDLYFKLHHVFEIKFDERLQNVMFFMKHYWFKMKDGAKKPTTKMIELQNYLASSNLFESTESTDQQIVQTA